MLLYEDEDLKLVFSPHPGERCFVTFTSWGDNRNQGFGQKFFDPRKMSGLYFISKGDHWWRTPHIERALAYARSAIAERGFRRVVAYGASMGGYGAALYARDVGAEFAILIAPQFEIRPDRPPFETRWAAEAKQIAFSGRSPESAIDRSQRLYIVYDPRSPDLAHVDLFAGKAEATRIVVPFGGHTPGVLLAQADMLKDLVFDLAAGGFDASAFRRRLRQRRRRSAVFWACLAEHAGKRRPALALRAITQATRLAPDDVVYALARVYLALRQQRRDEALQAAERAVELAPAHPASWRALAKARQAQGACEGAVSAAREAVLRRPRDADLQRCLLEALISAQRFGEAVPVAETAMALDPGFAKTAELWRLARGKSGASTLAR